MFLAGLFKKHSSVLGVDIGTSSIKLAQVGQKSSGERVLESYGIVNIPEALSGKNDPESLARMAELIKSLIKKAGISAQRSVISFPNSAVFSSVIELPMMNDKELDGAVEYEAKKYVPLALDEIDLSWTVTDTNAQTSSQKILLIAVPKQIKENYSKLFEISGLHPEAAEIEALALIRSLIGGEKINCVIIDIGAKSTGLNIIENGVLKLSRNLNVGGETITSKIAETLGINHSRAEQFKKDFGINGPSFIPEAVKPVLNIVKNEVKQLLTIYVSQDIRLDKVILAGGGSNMPGIIDFFADLKMPVELGNPLKNVAFSVSAEQVLKRYSRNLPVAIGLALRAE